MKNIVYLLTFSILLLGCGSKQVPDWTKASFNQLENYKKNYLSGKEQSAELYFNKAIDEIKKSGDLEILARVYLTKYAAHVAVLEDFDDGEYLRIDAIQPVLQNRNFYSFLKGSFDTVDEKLLPQQYDGFMRACRKGKIEDISNEISRMEDPLSKLIAIGLLVQKNTYDEGILKIAIDTASHNGWKKALLVYLDKLQSFYEMKKETQKAANIKQKIQLIKK
ncbi:MAG: hypothetical protein NTW12_08540 [Deltaproteobacteria bacterium]|nr:hypothetical protein [Deltaproteobacteria bacterium]